MVSVWGTNCFCLYCWRLPFITVWALTRIKVGLKGTSVIISLCRQGPDCLQESPEQTRSHPGWHCQPWVIHSNNHGQGKPNGRWQYVWFCLGWPRITMPNLWEDVCSILGNLKIYDPPSHPMLEFPLGILTDTMTKQCYLHILIIGTSLLHDPVISISL